MPEHCQDGIGDYRHVAELSSIVFVGDSCVPQIRIEFVTRSGTSLQVKWRELVTGNQMS